MTRRAEQRTEPRRETQERYGDKGANVTIMIMNWRKWKMLATLGEGGGLAEASKNGAKRVATDKKARLQEVEMDALNMRTVSVDGVIWIGHVNTRMIGFENWAKTSLYSRRPIGQGDSRQQ